MLGSSWFSRIVSVSLHQKGVAAKLKISFGVNFHVLLQCTADDKAPIVKIFFLSK